MFMAGLRLGRGDDLVTILKLSNDMDTLSLIGWLLMRGEEVVEGGNPSLPIRFADCVKGSHIRWSSRKMPLTCKRLQLHLWLAFIVPRLL